MKNIFLVVIVALCLAAISVQADLLDCNEKDQQDGQEVERSAIQKFGCQITRKAKEWGVQLKDNAKKWTEKAKDLGSDLKVKFNDFKRKLSSKESEEEQKAQAFLNRQVEIINPDVVKSEQLCGHGHILDALGNCSKLRR